MKKQYLEAKICNVIDYLSFLTLQTGNITLVKFGGRNITSQSLSDLNLPLKKKQEERKGTETGYMIQIFGQAMKLKILMIPDEFQHE